MKCFYFVPNSREFFVLVIDSFSFGSFTIDRNFSDFFTYAIVKSITFLASKLFYKSSLFAPEYNQLLNLIKWLHP
ncbi:hypothetical protein BpHYR1_018902 [Brachionus plicatilis]|uniref:Uncharacterized protein n=1 Tax=Brachionus plicatilis TaxID=10195 RepID=A0A3M7P830_BRAPC|nr:hypothetical protein BpHYR1_018902 [Brachionus plicatilis]